MYCRECGKQIDKDAIFCNYCGTEQEMDGNPTELFDQNQDIALSQEEIQKHSIFHDKNEKLIDILGSGFLSSLFVQDSFSKSVLFCSDKRVYQRGKLFQRNQQGNITYYHGERSVDLREITGLSLTIDDPISRFKFIGLIFILGIIGFMIAQEQRGDIKNIIILISGAFIFIGVVSWIIYLLKKGKWFIIEYAGGMIMTNCNWYSKKSIRHFMKNVSLQKDKLFEQKNNN